MTFKLVLDENISPLVASELRKLDYDVVHVRDVSLKGCRDSELLVFARETERCLVTLDAEFSDLRRYPLGTHSGIIRLRLQFASSKAVVSALVSLLPKLAHVPLEKGGLVVSDARKYRVRLSKEA